MRGFIKKILLLILPDFFKNWLGDNSFRTKLKKVQKNHIEALKKNKEKQILKVVFLLIHESVWKYEKLYWYMENDSRFEPIVVVCPYLPYGKDVMDRDMDQAYNNFVSKNYNVIKAWDESNKYWKDVKTEIKPDLVFFSVPHNLTRPEYLISNFLDTLSFYVPYAFWTDNRSEMGHNQLLHNYAFRIFQETDYHLGQARKYAKNHGKNCIVTGYPGLDYLLYQEQNKIRDVWKIKDPWIKRVIWAPHHAIETEENQFNFSNFIEYNDFFLEIAEKYRNRISIAFKPHPILKAKLCKLPDWGMAKTDIYYEKWNQQSNCQLVTGGYIDLFLTSDAMIHDSGSFLVEYISINKPSLFMVRNDLIESGFSDFGRMAFDAHYKSRCKEEIISFIEEVVLDGKDNLKSHRENLINCHLKAPNGKQASLNIYDHICGFLEV